MSAESFRLQAGASIRRPRRAEHGIVTAETALSIPALCAVALVLAWVVSLGASYARCQDASREAARLIARGDSEERAKRAALSSAPEGATVQIEVSDNEVAVTVSHTSAAPVLRFEGPTLVARSVTALEQADP